MLPMCGEGGYHDASIQKRLRAVCACVCTTMHRVHRQKIGHIRDRGNPTTRHGNHRTHACTYVVTNAIHDLDGVDVAIGNSLVSDWLMPGPLGGENILR